jgi:hypothetical protein
MLSPLFYHCSAIIPFKHIASYAPARCTILSKQLLTQTLKDRQTYLPHFTFRVQTTRSQPYPASGYGVDLAYSDDRAWAQTVLDRYRIAHAMRNELLSRSEGE